MNYFKHKYFNIINTEKETEKQYNYLINKIHDNDLKSKINLAYRDLKTHYNNLKTQAKLDQKKHELLGDLYNFK